MFPSTVSNNVGLLAVINRHREHKEEKPIPSFFDFDIFKAPQMFDSIRNLKQKIKKNNVSTKAMY